MNFETHQAKVDIEGKLGHGVFSKPDDVFVQYFLKTTDEGDVGLDGGVLRYDYDDDVADAIELM